MSPAALAVAVKMQVSGVGRWARLFFSLEFGGSRGRRLGCRDLIPLGLAPSAGCDRAPGTAFQQAMGLGCGPPPGTELSWVLAGPLRLHGCVMGRELSQVSEKATRVTET